MQGKSLFGGQERVAVDCVRQVWPFYSGNLLGKLQGPVQQWLLWAGDRSMEVTVKEGFTVFSSLTPKLAQNVLID